MRDDNNALGLFLSLKTAGANDAQNRNNTTISHNDGRGQNACRFPGIPDWRRQTVIFRNHQ
jgi:hypothetical protein